MEEDLNDEKAIELSSITAIYPEIVIDPSSPFRASLEIPISPTVPLKVRFQQLPDNIYFPTPPTSLEPSDSGVSNNVKDEERLPLTDGADPDIHTLSHLPPLTLGIELPDGYPAETPPKFTITTEPGWLPASKISELLDDGRRLWEECGKDLIVFAYIDHLQQCSENAFGLCDYQLAGATLSRDLKIALLDFDIKAKRERFERETFECGVCLEPRKGSSCHRLSLCSHVFCVSCLQDFYNTCINEGDIDNVKCPSPDCGKNANVPAQEDDSSASRRRKKQDRSLGPSELLQIPLEQEVVQRYVQLKRKRKLELDKTTVYCPREWCQGAARSKRHPKPVDPINDDIELSSDEEDEPMQFDPMGEEAQLPPMSERVAVCEDCSYAFCSVCRKGWHGELERCYPRRNAELTAEEKETEKYIKVYTSPCPTCAAPCQKIMGCNHMICFRCRSHFCYLCSTWLIEDNPYTHFNDTGSSCYMRLWDMEGGDGINPVGNQGFEFPADDFVIPDNDDDEDRPEWEFADDSDDEPGQALPRNQVRPPRPPPPPAPVPPQAAPPLNGNPNRGADDGLDAAGRAAAAEREALANAMDQIRVRPLPAGGAPPAHQRGQNRRGAPQPPQQPRNGLQRFLELVQNDQEDEWDSDELDEDF